MIAIRHLQIDEEVVMSAGSKEKYTAEQKRKAEHIEAGYEAKGISHEKAEQIAWATVNKQSGGGERSGSGVTTPEWKKAQARRDSARNAVETKHESAMPNSLEHQPLDILRAKARKKHISGRSTMNKEELIQALRRS
jgi:hypothetical protein